MKVLVTGAAGFIGYHCAVHLLDRGDEVVGVDSVNDYYDVTLKQARLERLRGRDGFTFEKLDIMEGDRLKSPFERERPQGVIHLAAQAGVRYSLTHPHVYIGSNVTGFLNILEAARACPVRHLVYASSSSVYGGNTQMPFSVDQNVDHPVSLYAATKKANELMAHSYSHLYGIPATGLRYFTVYGPWGRPDMVFFLFTRAILEDRPIDVYNFGRMQRDFTYIDDIVEGTVRVLDRPPTSVPPYRVYNIGNHRPEELLHVIELLERALGKKARQNLMPMQPGDVPATWADVADLQRDVGFAPATSLEDGVERFVRWFREYYRV